MRQDSTSEEGLHLGHDERRQRGRIAVGLQIGEKGPPVALQGLVEECLFGTMALVSLANSARMNDTGARRRCGAGVGRSSLRHQLRSSDRSDEGFGAGPTFGQNQSRVTDRAGPARAPGTPGRLRESAPRRSGDARAGGRAGAPGAIPASRRRSRPPVARSCPSHDVPRGAG